MRKLVACVALALSTSCGHSEDQRIVRSFAEMEQVARTAGSDDGATTRPQEVGEVEFQAIYREGDRVYFKVGENGPGVDPYGYVWSPEHVPVDDSNPSVASSFEHIQGPWYRWSDSY
ncbi:hypothetical protein HNP84_010150 [Thermocatellispora tengchongensis]|uniref:Uncharacterized protein n=1 Tax=Thermocatellispora tengchongensis TaxID=1073253 RepID=A0A840PQL6_9ACTN|nr:hypothetical protein [Thermocatellispora tengchongensis]MBB5140383.1 hypothetical protein [Thermocatellispora tengchongensis]